MVDIGSYILSGSQGLSRGIDNLGALWRDQAEKEAAQALIAKLSMGQQQGYPQQTLASLGAPPQVQQQPVPQGPNYPAYDAPIPPRRPADLGVNSGAVQQGMANEFGQKWAQAPGKIGGALPALAGVSSPQMAYASPAEQPTTQMRGPDGGGIPQRSQAMAFAPQQGSDMGRAGGAISGIESGGRYDALGPVTKGDRAYGKYQVMGANIPNWTAKYYGQPLSPAEFLANPQAQEAVFQGEFGRLSAKYGPEGASRAWFAGEGGMNDPNRRDVLGTSVAQYGSKFANAYSGGAPSQAQTNPLANVAPMGQQPQTLAMMGNGPQQSIDMGTLAALATNKYGAPIANAIMTRQLARDPIAQQLQMIELQKANMGLQNFPIQQQMLNEQLRAAQLGNQRTQAEISGESTATTPDMKEFALAKRQGFQGTFLDYQQAKSAAKQKPGLSAADQKVIFAEEDQLPVIDNTIETLKRAKELNSKTYTGVTAGARGQVMSSIGLGGESAAATREFGQIMSMEAIKSMSSLLKGATTDKEMMEFQRLLSDPATPPDIRERTINRMLQLAERQKQIATGRINELRSKGGQAPINAPRQQGAVSDPLGIR